MLKSLANNAIEGLRGETKGPRRVVPDDKLLLEFAEHVKPKIVIIGVGGAGCNTITRLNGIGIEGVETVAANTDVQHLLRSVASRKVLLGKQLCGGYGAGADYRIGEEAAKESSDEIRKIVEKADIVFVTAGLGGGTGTGGAPVIAEVAREMGAVVVGIVTLPFEAEGDRRRSVAQWGLERLSKNVDTLVVIRNDRILEITGELPMHQAFLVADELMARAIKAISDVAQKPALINVDLADLRTILENGGLALMGVGESDSENRAMKALQEALENPLFEGDISGATGAIVHISCGSDFSLDEMGEVLEAVAGILSPEANLIWGVGLEESLKSAVRVLVIIVGVKSPIFERISKAKELKAIAPTELIRGSRKVPDEEKIKELTDQLEIERI
ncbi:MAG: cell division protein FtsZ [Thermoproteota archaeon]|nr:MAG: cell division protein FtsZ [Candidatus Korarchaeota archaeon]